MADFDAILQALSAIPKAVDRATKRGLRKGAVRVMGKAKGKLGTYQPASGGYPAWPKLKPATVKHKYTSRTGKITRAGQRYLRDHGSWGAGGNNDAPLVSTGHLRQAITLDDSELDSTGAVYVGVAAGSSSPGMGSSGDYAAAHEFGYAPKGIPARPYLRPALQESRDDIKEDVSKELSSELQRAVRS